MALYNWEATNNSGLKKKGVLDAPSKQAVESRLRQMGLTPGNVKKQPRSINIEIPGLGGVPSKSKVVFTRQLATMVDAGLPLVQCLEILGTQEPNPQFQKTILSVKGTVEAGSTFADSLAKHPKVFDNLYVNLCAAGEVGGILDTILNRLAAYMEKSMKLKAKIKGAMKYPITVLVISVIISGFLLVKVVPSFAGMFTSMGSELPTLTAAVVKVSNATVKNLPMVIAVLLVITALFIFTWKNDRTRFVWDKILLRMPMFGPLLTKAAVARFTRTLGTLISSGVPILDSLQVVARTAGNKVIERAIMITRTEIAEGKNIADPLAEQNVFPAMVVQMVAVGESTGALDIMLGKIADFYDDEVDEAVDGLTSLIEPLIMVVLGGMIGTVLLAMYMPIFSMADAVG